MKPPNGVHVLPQPRTLPRNPWSSHAEGGGAAVQPVSGRVLDSADLGDHQIIVLWVLLDLGILSPPCGWIRLGRYSVRLRALKMEGK